MIHFPAMRPFKVFVLMQNKGQQGSGTCVIIYRDAKGKEDSLFSRKIAMV